MEAEKVRAYYNQVAGRYAAERYEGCKGRYYMLETSLIRGLVNFSKKNVLDLGTGTGRFIPEIARTARRIIGVDFSEKMIKIAKAKNIFPNTTFLVMDAKNLGFQPESFDAVLSLGMFEYITDFSPFLEEIKRVLRKRGDFIFTCHNKHSFFPFCMESKSPFGRSRHSLDEIEEKLHKHGFEIIWYRSIFHIPPFFSCSGMIEFLIFLNKLLVRLFSLNGRTLVIHAKKV